MNLSDTIGNVATLTYEINGTKFCFQMQVIDIRWEMKRQPLEITHMGSECQFNAVGFGDKLFIPEARAEFEIEFRGIASGAEMTEVIEHPVMRPFGRKLDQ